MTNHRRSIASKSGIRRLATSMLGLAAASAFCVIVAGAQAGAQTLGQVSNAIGQATGSDPINARLTTILPTLMNNLAIVSVATIIGAFVFLGYSFFSGQFHARRIIATVVATAVICMASTIGQYIAGGNFSWNSATSVTQSTYGGN
jgi:hypothetical protein